jgi:SAM-dependent methyltransferase
VGDIETYPLPHGAYDAILCWTVLEHLAKPRIALANMAQSLRPRGLLIVGVPDPWSLKGLVTKLTPHRFHVWAYRRCFGMHDAGQPGRGPFRTHLCREIAPKRLEQLARSEGLERIYVDFYEPALGLPPALKLPWSLANLLGRVVTRGSWRPQLSEHVAVFRKLDTV